MNAHDNADPKNLVPGASFVQTWAGFMFDRPVPVMRRRNIQPGDIVLLPSGKSMRVTDVTAHRDSDRFDLVGETDGDGSPGFDDSNWKLPVMERNGHRFGYRLPTGTEPVQELAPFEVIDVIVVLDELNANLAEDPERMLGYLVASNPDGLRDAMVALIEPCGYLYDPDDVHVGAALTLAAEAYKRILRIHLNAPGDGQP